MEYLQVVAIEGFEPSGLFIDRLSGEGAKRFTETTY